MADASRVKAATTVTKKTRVKNEPSVPRHIPAGKPSNPRDNATAAADKDKK